uniref:RRM domain-containing protein n=1 Tax=Populus trichocarpa TaxID=3694 RepID=A0A2K2AGL5_POPTR
MNNKMVAYYLPPSDHYQVPTIPSIPPPTVRILFVAGLPDDIKPSEIYSLFREFPGYESSHLHQPSAVAAMHALNGMVFDLERGSTLYTDLAKSNARSISNGSCKI